MRPPHLSRWFGLALVGVLLISFVGKATLRAGHPTATVASASVSGAFGAKPAEPSGSAEPSIIPTVVHLMPSPLSAEALQTHMKLMEEHSINFPDGAKLEEVKQYIEKVTADEDEPDSGLAVYFDPQGLHDAEKTMASTVSLSFKRPIRLGRSLELLLKQANLRYLVADDGILVITSLSDDGGTASLGEQTLKEVSELRLEVAALRDVLSRHWGEISRERSQGASASAGVGGGMGGGFR